MEKAFENDKGLLVSRMFVKHNSICFVIKHQLRVKMHLNDIFTQHIVVYTQTSKLIDFQLSY